MFLPVLLTCRSLLCILHIFKEIERHSRFAGHIHVKLVREVGVSSGNGTETAREAAFGPCPSAAFEKGAFLRAVVNGIGLRLETDAGFSCQIEDNLGGDTAKVYIILEIVVTALLQGNPSVAAIHSAHQKRLLDHLNILIALGNQEILQLSEGELLQFRQFHVPEGAGIIVGNGIEEVVAAGQSRILRNVCGVYVIRARRVVVRKYEITLAQPDDFLRLVQIIAVSVEEEGNLGHLGFLKIRGPGADLCRGRS